ncbi:hypothetical protein KY359_04685 [Candidatus Woesearchaeota archaeon]|nr:hypothetical protein [Candidatus Woesearchaeota archaeon]
MAKEELRVLRERVLSDCPQGLEFWTCHGTIIKNIYELKNTIRALNEYAFKYHVNEDNSKNDFAEWIADVLGDPTLAKKLAGVMDRDKYLSIIEKRIKQFEAA